MATNIEEQLSALVDGELTDREMNEVLAGMRSRPELRERWARYHLISDGIHRSLPGRMQHDLQARVSRAIAQEPVILAPVQRRKHMSPRFKQATGIALAACVTAVAILGFQNMGPGIQLPWTAEAPSDALITADNDLAPYLMNHNEYVASAGYGMLPYVRLVSHNAAETETE